MSYSSEDTRGLLNALDRVPGVLEELRSLLENLTRETARAQAAIDLLKGEAEAEAAPSRELGLILDVDGDLWHEDTDGIWYVEFFNAGVSSRSTSPRVFKHDSLASLIRKFGPVSVIF